MDRVIDLQALVGHLESLLRTLPNVPPPAQAQSNKYPKPIQPLLDHKIPALPLESFQLPPKSQSQQSLLTYLSTHILPHINGAALSPNYYGLVTGGTTPAALLADWLVSLYDQNVCLHLPNETITTTIEAAALNQLRSLLSLPQSTWGIGPHGPASGTFTTGATGSNILGLALGREFTISHAASKLPNLSDPAAASVATHGLLPACLTAGINRITILSALPHSSVLKAAALLGLGRSSSTFISIASPSSPTTISLDRLRTEASVPHRASILVVGVGEVNTGHFATSSLSQWRELRALCDELGVWVHVDGAFGLFARILSGEGGEYDGLVRGTEGVELADSITGDAHKLLNVPYDCGFFFTRHKALAERVCLNSAPYLSTEGLGAKGTGMGKAVQEDDDGIQTPLNITLENSRRWRALPVHATLMAYGREGYVDMLKRQVGLARRVVRWLLGPGRELYQVLPSSSGGQEDVDVEGKVRETFMIVLFRARDEGVNEELVERIKRTRRMYVSGTVWEGRKATRIAVSHWQVDVDRDGKLIEEVLLEVAKS